MKPAPPRLIVCEDGREYLDRFTRFQELTRMMAESVNDVATVQRTLQRTLESTEDELAARAGRRPEEVGQCQQMQGQQGTRGRPGTPCG